MQKLLSMIESKKDVAVGFLADLVRFDSAFIDQGVGGNEWAIQQWLDEQLRGWGLETRQFEPSNEKMEKYPDFNPGHDYTKRPNLIAVLKGTGGGRSLILNGHVDTVPVGNRDEWSHDPFAAEVVGDDMIGRGTCDMKAGLAAMIMAVKFLTEAGARPKGDVIIQSVVDEEGGGNGTLACVAEGSTADAAIVCEPTSLKILPASRGVFLLQVDVKGKSTHAALKWQGVNAVEKGIKIIQGLQELERLWLANRNNPLLPSPTITIGQIQGGLAGAIVPGECVMKFDVKYLPMEVDSDGNEKKIRGEDVKKEVEECIAAVCRGDEWLRDHPPKLYWYLHVLPHHLDPDHAIVKTLCAGSEKARGEAVVSGMPSGADARILQNAGKIPTVIFGPGNLSDAHSVDEHVSLTQYLQAIKILALTIVKWTSE